jgi:hypothetical protein
MGGVGVAEMNKRSTAFLLVVFIGLKVVGNDDERRRRAARIRRRGELGFQCTNRDDFG